MPRHCQISADTKSSLLCAHLTEKRQICPSMIHSFPPCVCPAAGAVLGARGAQGEHAGQDSSVTGGDRAGALPLTASDVLPKGSARGRSSGSRSAGSGDLSPSISFSGASRKRRKGGNREKKQKKEKDNINEGLSSWLTV